MYKIEDLEKIISYLKNNNIKEFKIAHFNHNTVSFYNNETYLYISDSNQSVTVEVVKKESL